MVKSSNELMKRIVSLELLKNIKESDLNLEILDNQLYFYQSYLDFLKNNKPLFFQRKKLKTYKQKVEECRKNINGIYLLIGQEMEIIEENKQKIS